MQSLKDDKKCKVARIVAACHLHHDNVQESLDALAAVPMVGGIRLIIDHCGEKFNGKNATHFAVSRFDIDLMRDEEWAPKFEKVYAIVMFQVSTVKTVKSVTVLNIRFQ